jgi:hypothetical protein
MAVGEDRRSFLTKVAVGAGIFMGGGIGYQEFGDDVRQWMVTYERSDDRIETEEMSESIRQVLTDQAYELSALDWDRAEVDFEPVGETGQDTAVYALVGSVPLGDDDVVLCEYDTPAGEQALAEMLLRDMELIFDALYDEGYKVSEMARKAKEDQVNAFEAAVTDPKGRASVRFDAQEAYEIAQEADYYEPDNDTDHENFVHRYRLGVELEC